MKMMVGLGNPGQRYAHTPHNVGFETLDFLAKHLKRSLRLSLRGNARYCKTMLEGEQMLLMQPLTYMNLSGTVVAPLARRKGIVPSDIIVAMDDADLPLGQIRIRPSGGSGGHKGLQSIIDNLGTEQVPRVRLGVGRRSDAEDLKEHVLTRFTPSDWREAEEMIRRAAEAMIEIVRNGVEKAMNMYNAPSAARCKLNAQHVPADRQTKGASHDKI